ncbi:5-carboxyvanillate decarboxylase [Legionella geestiana]|uniref:5-carboxyvanillate decarboxylase n=1 Tax=Legionella geestiana TaxID=45065 RepID=A0A0W0TLL6_9GAMM|nr:amidohydrolase family protein [Legionella geestiana]KTC96511.1 5-carboxyvanillate decarboxylase [Legionella geestiana]QBS12552.1 amidohydrolase [Legionella geestiana]QDQ39732.1 amidohydrolase [Legionella geestiana]STX55001.1 5-carboxyvanillate decarboxylase [Legionella geestiana]
MRSIDLETHFYTQAAFEYLASRKAFPRLEEGKYPGIHYLRFNETVTLVHDEAFISRLCDMGEQRIAMMDAAGLDVQVLSFSTPGLDECSEKTYETLTTMARMHNDVLHEAIKRHPGRFEGFATLALQSVKEAVLELTRCVSTLGFKGWLTHANYGKDIYLDNRQFWPLLEAAEALNIPVYLHPTIPQGAEYGQYGFALAGPALGFQFETSLCLLRMIYAGVFDAFPKLQIIIGHLGETLPFLVPDRIDWAYVNPGLSKLPAFIDLRPKIDKTPSEVLLNNVHVTTSGRFSKAALDFVIRVMGIDRVLLATDYPYEDLQRSMDFIRNCGLTDKELRKICFENAQNMGFGLNG